MKFKSILSALLVMLFSAAVLAHGTKYEILKNKELRIKASFDTGEPMAGAEVLIFAPETMKPESKTLTDNDGVFLFTPDKSGVWILQVRDRAGHGMRINLDIDDSLSISGEQSMSGGVSLLQKLVMAFCVVLGFTGIALYFKGKREK